MKQRLIAAFAGFFAALLLFTGSAIAQNKTVTGKVTDAQGGVGLTGVSVQVKGSQTGTSTSAEGAYTISVPANGTLVFSFIGFKVQEVAVGTRSIVDVSLASSTANDLNEVVVIGYGTARKKDITGSVSSIKSKDFNQGVIAAPDQLIQGKVAGLEITSNSGQPGAATTIKIRGNNSIRANNNPLYVVDGVPLDGRTARPSLDLGGSLGFGTTPESNPLLYINPNDIAQIDVLKDASAAAIYGSRGANGIVVITTKKGTTGTKLEFGSNFGMAAGYMHKYKVLSASEFRAETKKRSLNFDSSATVDPLKEITQNTLTQNYALAINGGNDAGRFRVSFLGSTNQGFLKKTSLDKYLGSFNGQYKFLEKRLSLDFNLISGHTTEHMGLVSNTAGAGGNLMSYSLQWNPTKALKDRNGLYNLLSNSVPNPLAVSEGFHDQADVNVFLGNISAGYKIIEGLDYKFLYAINHGAGTRNTSIEGWIEGIQGVSGTGFAAISNAKLTSQTFTHTLQYRTKFGEELNFDALAGYEYWKTDFSNSTAAASKFNTNLTQSTRIPVRYTSMFQNAQVQSPLFNNVDPNVELQSVFGRVNFNLSDKYYITATIRADGSSKFGANSKYGYFPSVGARWLVSNEKFLKNNNFLSNLSLRGSWGITGNQEFPAGASLEQFNSSAYNSFGQSNVANPDLRWEKTTTINLGLDYTLLKGKVYGSFDYYRKNTTDLLFQSTAIQPAPASVFFINLPANLINSGVEFSIASPIISKRNLTWDLGFNIAYNKNNLTNFSEAPIETALVSGQGLSGATAQRIANNQPVNVYYLKQFKGFDQSGQQIISENAMYSGNPNPKFLIGFSSSVVWKKLSVNLNGSGSLDYLIYNNTYNSITNISNLQNGKNVSATILSSSENLNASVAASTRYLESGSFFKFRNLSVSYAIGNIGKVLKNVSVYASGTNLFVITKFTGFDPEVNVDKTNNGYPSRNMEYLPYPTPRIVTVGFNLAL